MDIPYGYRESDFIALSEFIVKGGFGGRSLSDGFKAYASVAGKAAGSIRNLYYALAKFSRENAEFTAKYLGGKQLKVEKGETFSPEEEKNLLNAINGYKERGVSVRKATMTLAGGDAKKALRLQNKFRTATRAGKFYGNNSDDKQTGVVKDFLTKRLKKEIDLLFDRFLVSANKENAALKKEIFNLKSENERLYKEVYGKSKGAMAYFSKASGAQILRP